MSNGGEPLKVLSLFSGVGGFDMGLTNTGKMTTAFMCEIDKHARSVLDYHWPEVPKWDDVTTLTGAYILEKTGGVDVVAWGSPCQDLSIAGKRAGLTGERSGLFHHGIRIIKELRELSNGKYPTWSIWENVAGALSSNKGADFGEVLYEMDEAGACFSEWSLLDAQYFGVPQRRRRVFVTSCFDSSVSEGCPEPLLPVAQGLPGDSASRSKARQGVTGASSDSVGAGSQLATGKDIANTISASLYHKSTVVNQDVNNGHLVVEQPLAFDTQFGSNANVFENQSPTLKSSQQPPSVTQYVDSNKPIIIDRAAFNQGVNALYEAVISEDDVTPPLVARGPHAVGQNAIPIQDGREIEKNQNGLGIGAEGDPSYTLDQTGAQAVAYSIREDAKANTFSATEVETARALQALQPAITSHHAQNIITQPVLMRQREGKPGGGKGPLLSENISLTLSGGNDQILFTDAPLLLDGRRVDDVRVYTEPVQTLQERMGTGGNNVPVVAQETYVKSRRAQSVNDHETWVESDVAPTLNIFDVGDIRTTTTVIEPVQAISYDGYNQTIEEEIHRSWRIGRDSSDFVADLRETEMIVRRLTPLECERLMGWPDGHTAEGINGPVSDTQRYKMCGNGVASPVAQWIGEHIARASGRG
jgi:DNA (cytosine-5)-methyltransferase 1